MNTMSLPGFTAENSIYVTQGHYSMTTAFDTQNASTNVQPALPQICDVLAERVWAAYNEGAYHRGEFWLKAMERAGCFN
ncbi:MAG: hypothetical protein R2867_32250 [Caldilineaceae bacterium]